MVTAARRRRVGVGGASRLLAPHLVHTAETRAKARPRRDAVNVGVVSFEELDGDELPGSGDSALGAGAQNGNGSATSPRRRGRGLAAPRKQSAAMTESQRQ